MNILTVYRTMPSGQKVLLGQLVHLRPERQTVTGAVFRPNVYAFSYDSAYQGAPIHPDYPVVADKIYYGPTASGRENQQLHPVFQDCIPDGWGRMLIEKAMARENIENTPMNMLAWIGDRGMGALSWYPKKNPDSPAVVDFTLLAASVMGEFEQRDEADIPLFKQLAASGASNGTRPKIMLTRSVDAYGRTQYCNDPNRPGEKYLFKFSSVFIHPFGLEECMVEFLYNDMACLMGMETCPFTASRQVFNRVTYSWSCQQRFDCTEDTGRYHVLSMAAFLGRNDAQPPADWSYVDMVRRITELVGERGALSIIDKCFFNYLMCNEDDHTRNFSLLLDENEQWQVAPAYDIMFLQTGHGRTTPLAFTRSGIAEHIDAEVITQLADAGDLAYERVLARYKSMARTLQQHLEPMLRDRRYSLSSQFQQLLRTTIEPRVAQALRLSTLPDR